MTVGILGGGQLGRMLALAGYPLGLRFVIVDPSAEACAGRVAPLLNQDYLDPSRVTDTLRSLDVVTYEFENVNSDSPWLCGDVPVYPPTAALRVMQDRLAEKTLFSELGIDTPDYFAVDSLTDLHDAIARTGFPAVLKTRRFGYDGKGQYVLSSSSDVADGGGLSTGRPLILESFVRFDRELSIIAVRSARGETAFYPLIENLHRDGILRRSVAPVPSAPSSLQANAEAIAARILERLSYVGVLAIEFFQLGEKLLANEMAPRVHNSGHWTIEGAETSQFENHLRAILGLPLGSTAARGLAGMVNLIGDIPRHEDILAIRGAHLHAYDKSPKPGRKVGHVTLVCEDRDELMSRISQVEGLLV